MFDWVLNTSLWSMKIYGMFRKNSILEQRWTLRSYQTMMVGIARCQ